MGHMEKINVVKALERHCPDRVMSIPTDDQYCDCNGFPACLNQGEAYVSGEGLDPSGADEAVVCTEHLLELIRQGAI